MKKIDALLKKAELFEKLALYGDRTNFLEALSEDQSNNTKKHNKPSETTK